jgi:cell wall-associated NlpC family hydrolase
MSHAIKTCAVVCMLFALAGCATNQTGTAPHARDQSQNNDNPVVSYALDLMGTPYIYGGKDPQSGFDCSGLVSHVYAKAGVRLEGSAADIARQGKKISKSQLKAGDLVFFNTLNRPLSHVGIYIGNGRFVHAPGRRDTVRVSELSNPYFAARYETARTYVIDRGTNSSTDLNALATR